MVTLSVGLKARRAEHRRQAMDTTKDWYTIQELAEMLGVSYSKLRGEISALANVGVITTRPKPGDNKTQEISKESLPTIRKATGVGQ